METDPLFERERLILTIEALNNQVNDLISHAARLRLENVALKAELASKKDADKKGGK